MTGMLWPAREPSRLAVVEPDASLVHGVSPLTTLLGRVTGTKPAAFCRWVFTLLGAAPGDSLDDLFPGSGTVGRAWAAFTAEASPQARADASAQVLHDTSAPPGSTDGCSTLQRQFGQPRRQLSLQASGRRKGEPSGRATGAQDATRS